MNLAVVPPAVAVGAQAGVVVAELLAQQNVAGNLGGEGLVHIRRDGPVKMAFLDMGGKILSSLKASSTYRQPPRVGLWVVVFTTQAGFSSWKWAS